MSRPEPGVSVLKQEWRHTRSVMAIERWRAKQRPRTKRFAGTGSDRTDASSMDHRGPDGDGR